MPKHTLVRLSPVALAAFLLIIWAWAAQATLLLGRWPTGTASAPTIGSIALSGTTFPSGSASGVTIGTISANMTNGSFTGSFSLTAADGSCPSSNNASVQIVGTTLETNSLPVTGPICIRATQAGMVCGGSTTGSTGTCDQSFTVTAVSTTQTTGLFGIDSSVTDTSGNSYTVCGTGNEQICQNGVVDPITGGVVLVTWYSGHLYQENNTQAWYEWNSASYPTWGSGGGAQWTFLGTGPSSAPSGWAGITFVSLSNGTFTTPTSGTTAIGNFTITATSTFSGTNALSTSGACSPTTGAGNIALNISGSAPSFTLNAINGVWPWSLAYCTVLTQSGFVNSPLAFTGTAVGSTPGITTYYMATAAEGGSDSNNGTSVTTPWLTPNHAALACGNQIIAQTGTYVSANLVVTTAPSCSGGNNAVIVACEITHECGGDMLGGNGPQIQVSNFGFIGWSIHDCNACFSATPGGSSNIGYIVDADNIAYNGQQEGFTTYPSGGHSVDNIIILGNLSQNTAQTTGNCDSGISIGEPGLDSTSSHVIYGAWNMSWDNTTSSCLSGQDSDLTGIAIDTWGGLSYTGTGVFENNWLVHNGGAGLEVTEGNGTQATHSKLVIRYNTALNNLTIHQNSVVAELAIGLNVGLYGVTATNNLTWGQQTKVASYNAPTAMFGGINDDVSGTGGTIFDKNFNYQTSTGWGNGFWNGSTGVINCQSGTASGQPYDSDSFQNVGCPGESNTTNPSITSPTADPGVPSSCNAVFALQCVATYITDYESTVASNAGAQVGAPSDANNTTTFECNIYAILPSGMFATDGGYIPNRSSSCSAGPGGAVKLATDNATTASGAVADPIPTVGSTQTLTFPFSITENGGVSEPERVVVFNTGTPTLTVSSVTYTGTNSGDFSTATTNCSGSLTHNSYCYIWANFSPTTAGAESATMNINFTSGTVSLALAGTGQTQTGGVVNASCSSINGTTLGNATYVLPDGTCSGITFHTSAGAVLQGDCKAPEGVNTIFNGNNSLGEITDGLADAAQNVTIRCVTIEQYANDGGCGLNNGFPQFNTYTGWLLANDTLTLACDTGTITHGTSTEIYDTHVSYNQVTGMDMQGSGTLTMIGDEFDHNSTNTGSGGCLSNFDCGAFKVTGPQATTISGLYSHDQIYNTGYDPPGAWCDGSFFPGNCGSTFTVENSTIINNAGDGIRNEVTNTPGVFAHNVITGNATANTDGEIAVPCSPTVTITDNYITTPGAPAFASGVGIYDRCSPSSVTWSVTSSGNIIVFNSTGFQYGIVGAGSGNVSSISSNNNTFYTGGNLTSSANFANNPNSFVTENFATWKSNTGQDGSSTIQTGTPANVPSGCTGDGVYGIGCRGSGM